jgi:hypothetical protein
MKIFFSDPKKIGLVAFSIAYATTLMYGEAAFGAAATPATIGAASLSFGAAATIAGTGATIAVKKEGWFATAVGGVVALGGVAVGLADPPSGIFYSGTFTYHYDSNVMEILNSGWLGSWGADPTLLAPPVNPDLWDGPNGEPTIITLQQPNSNLSASIVDDIPNGLRTISFNWGSTGHPEDSPDPFNFFATTFEFKKTAKITYLGDFTAPPPTANFFLSNDTFKCSIPTLPPPDDTIIKECGRPVTSYFLVTAVPDPSSILGLLALGTLGAASTLKRKLKPSQSIKKETTKVG